MPTLADLSIKKADGTTTLVYTAIASGTTDGTPSVFRAESVGTIAGNRPVLQISLRSSKDREARLADLAFSYPETVTDSTTGVVTVRKRVWFKGTFCQNSGANDSTNQEAAYQLGNLLSTQLVRDILRYGLNAR